MNKNKIRIEDIFGIICIAIGAGVLLRSACLTVSDDIWFDELFTVELAAKPVGELISLAARDVHPPLYYMIVRVIYLVLHGAAGVGLISAAKFASVIPYFILLIYMVTFVRKRFGWLGAGLSYLLILVAPKMPEYMVEARMYSWCAFSVAAMFMHAYAVIEIVKEQMSGTNHPQIYVNQQSSQSLTPASVAEKRYLRGGTSIFYVNLIATLLYGISAMYLHYYSAIAAVLIAVWMVAEILICLREAINKKQILTVCIICLVIAAAAYIPWIRSALSQAGAVKSGYWIQPLTWRTFPGCIKYIFTPEFESNALNVVLCAASVVSLVVMLGILIYQRNGLHKSPNSASVHTGGLHKSPNITSVHTDKPDDSRYISLHNATYILPCFLIPACTVLIGIILSFLIKPVFVYRYMIPVMALFWMGCGCLISHCISYVNRNIVIVFALCFVISMALTGFRDINGFIGMEKFKSAQMDLSDDIFDEIKTQYPDELIVCNFNQIQALMWHYLPNDSVLWGETDELLIADICDRAPITMTDDYEELRSIVTGCGQNEFLFFGSFNARDEIINLWQQEGASCELIYDSVFVERYYFNIYRITVD